MPDSVLIPAELEVKPFVAARFRFDWKTGTWLLALFSFTRFALVLNANLTRNYQVVALVFVAMLLLPWLLLTRAGRRTIGLVWPRRWAGVLLGGSLGALSCVALYYLTTFCYGLGEGNSLVYISRTYGNLPAVLTDQNRLLYFLIFAGTSMVFSPLGEEVFYRGLIHECFARSVGSRKATWIDSTAFALVHMAHFGLVYAGPAGGWHLLPGPALLWMTCLLGTCLLFSLARSVSGSLVGSIVAHALFNLTMNYFIFYHIL